MSKTNETTDSITQNVSSFTGFKSVHVLAEVVVLCGVVIFFYRKSISLSSKIEELSKRLDEQDEMIQNHEEVLKKISIKLNSLPSSKKIVVGAAKPKEHTISKQSTPQSVPTHIDIMSIFGMVNQKNAPSDVKIEEISCSDETCDINSPEELDNELENELEDLKSA